ncbi:hypothetical protein BSG1_14844 [Bacillus sp. SG-1]|nr:hypothetical protein BSG1_14844 [Bacillus sp. SG-1]
MRIIVKEWKAIPIHYRILILEGLASKKTLKGVIDE